MKISWTTYSDSESEHPCPESDLVPTAKYERSRRFGSAEHGQVVIADLCSQNLGHLDQGLLRHVETTTKRNPQDSPTTFRNYHRKSWENRKPCLIRDVAHIWCHQITTCSTRFLFSWRKTSKNGTISNYGGNISTAISFRRALISCSEIERDVKYRYNLDCNVSFSNLIFSLQKNSHVTYPMKLS